MACHSLKPEILDRLKSSFLFLLGWVPREKKTAWMWPWNSRCVTSFLTGNEKNKTSCLQKPASKKKKKKKKKFWLPLRRTAEELGLIGWHSHRSFAWEGTLHGAGTPQPPHPTHPPTHPLKRTPFVHAEEGQLCAGSNDGSTFTRLEKEGKGEWGVGWGV